VKLVWKKLAIKDRERIMDYTAEANPQAALD
jgi:plasmid stabilization system protein ParE